TTPAETTPVDPYAGWYNAEDGSIDVSKFDILTAFAVFEFEASNGITMPYRLYLPPDYNEDEEYPLLVYLHGNGSQGTDNEAQLENGATWYFRNAESPAFGAIVLAPQFSSVNKNWWSGENLDALVEIINYVNETYSTSSSRQYISGTSAGGDGTWRMLKYYPEMVSAALPVAAYSFSTSTDEEGNLYLYDCPPEIVDIPIRMVWDTDDVYSPDAYNSKIYNKLLEMGHENLSKHVTGGNGHTVCQKFIGANDIDDLVWLFEQERETGGVNSREDGVSNMDERFLKGTYTAENGVEVNYRLYLPDGYTAENTYPQLLYLHTENTSGDDNTKHLEEIDPFFDRNHSPVYKSIVVVPQCPADQTWTGELLAAVEELMTYVESAYNADPTRRYIVGRDMGSTGAWKMLTRYTDKIAGVSFINGEPLSFDENGNPNDLTEAILKSVHLNFTYDANSATYYEKVLKAFENGGSGTYMSYYHAALNQYNENDALCVSISSLYYFCLGDTTTYREFYLGS
ncbi:MAG: hypothetical protein IJY12_04360, partial [Clostridia bacterium]|nr:hypothetical protein [Clostridia bacterium]